MGIFAASSRSSANLIKILLPIKARLISEQNNYIKNIRLGISNIPNNLLKSSLIPDTLKTDVVHVAYFISDTDKFSNKGIILDYGSYEYINDEKLAFEYKEEGGLRYGYISYDSFLKDSGKAAMINLDLSKSAPIRFNYLIDELKKNNSWKKDDYSSIAHNCQHFAIEVIKILKPRFNPIGILPGENANLIEGRSPEEIIPNNILKVLKEISNNTNSSN